MAAAAIIRISDRNGEAGQIPGCAPAVQASKKK
jgi:hypothetical protein